MLTIYRLHWNCRAVDPILLHQFQGAALRGALYRAMQATCCSNHTWSAACPVCTLFAPRDPASERGDDPPRPFAIHPPLHTQPGHIYQHGQSFSWDLLLFGDAIRRLPLFVAAIDRLERDGLGQRVGTVRGRFKVESITCEGQILWQQGDPGVRIPEVGIDQAQVKRMVQAYPQPLRRISLIIHTPLRLLEKHQPVRDVTLDMLLLRISARLTALDARFGAGEPVGTIDRHALLVASHGVQTTADLHWVDVESYSSRQRQRIPIGGWLGRLTYTAHDLGSLVSWLIWGSLIGVGKGVVKGNGWYSLDMTPAVPHLGTPPPVRLVPIEP